MISNSLFKATVRISREQSRQRASQQTCVRRRLTANAAQPATPARSAFELDEAPLFSLRTRVLFFTTVGTVLTGSVLSFWFGLDRENAYWAEERFPKAVEYLGPYVGLPVNSKTGRLDREVLGPRDVRDMVGERVSLVGKTRDGRVIVIEADALEPLDKIAKDMPFEDIDVHSVKAT